MKRPRDLQILILLSMTLLFTPAPLASTMRGIQLATKSGEVLNLYSDYYALVIGVGRYTNGWPDLPGAAKDSAEVASALEGYGFRVKHVANPTSREIKKAITEMAVVTGREEQRALLLYFAGHGETVNLADGSKLGFIIPADCPLKDKDPVGFDDLAISMKEIEALALKVQSKHVLMVFDSCFSGALFSLVRAAPVEISEKSARPVRQFITAGSEGEQVPDRSVFKQVFLDGIKSDADLNSDGYVTASELGMYLQTKVVTYSSGGQHPQYGKINNPKLDKGDFIFVVPDKGKKTPKAEEKPPEVASHADDFQKLRGEFMKLQQMLEARTQSEAKEREMLAEKRSLEEKIKSNEQEQQKEQGRIRDETLERERKELDARLRTEAAEKKALEEELKRIRADQEQAKLRQEAEQRKVLDEELKKLRAQQTEVEMKRKAEKPREDQPTLPSQNAQQASSQPVQVASIPPDVKTPVISSTKPLRSKPVELSELDLKKMLSRNNFYVKHKNEEGSFQNDFSDNGDGTVTDRATGLIWQKGGSPSTVDVRGARKYVEGLNANKFSGHADWRVPSLEELCSLLQRPTKSNDYATGLLEQRKKIYWSADWLPPHPLEMSAIVEYHAVDFEKGIISLGNTGDGRLPFQQKSRDLYFVRAVRTLEP